jgi:hypothetical protein
MSSDAMSTQTSHVQQRRNRWETPVFAVVVVILQAIRYAKTTNRVWAEDGAIFGRQAFDLRPLQAIRETYAGYLVVGQRAIAAPIVRVVPPHWWSEWFAAAAIAVATMAAITVFRCARSLIPSPIVRAVLATYLAVGPKMRGEWPSITNIAWPLLLAVFWAIVTTETDRLTRALRVLVSLTPLCTPLAILFLPICLIVVVVRRSADRAIKFADWMVAVTLGMAAVVQVLAMQTAAPGPTAEGWTALGVARLMLVRAAGSVLIGEKWLSTAWIDHGDIVSFAGLTLLIMLIAFCFAQRKKVASRYALAALVFGLSIGSLSLILRGMTRFALLKGAFSANADRYFLLPTFLVLSALFIMVSQIGRKWVPIALSAYIAIVSIGTGFLLPGSDGDPIWETELAKTEAACAAAVSPKPSLKINTAIAPLGIFQFAVPCKRLK